MPRLRLAGPREASLADAFSRAQTPCDAIAALDEYAWRSLKAGVRVRDYCNAADRIVHMVRTKVVAMTHLVASLNSRA
jgi:hypothetical protein